MSVRLLGPATPPGPGAARGTVAAYDLSPAALSITTEGGQQFSFSRPLHYSLGRSLDDDTAPRRLELMHHHSGEVFAALDVPQGHPLIALLDGVRGAN